MINSNEHEDQAYTFWKAQSHRTTAKIDWRSLKPNASYPVGPIDPNDQIRQHTALMNRWVKQSTGHQQHYGTQTDAAKAVMDADSWQAAVSATFALIV